MNKVYLYDSTFNSLLALINYVIKNNIENISIKDRKNYISNLFELPTEINLDINNELNELKGKINKKMLIYMYYVFLSNNQNKELVILDFYKQCLKYKNNTIYYRNIDSINSTVKLFHQVSSEAHKLKGFLRFKGMKKFLYAEINPTNNVISILANHFKKRLSNEYFIIKDINRLVYAVYDKNKIIYLTENEIIKLDFNLEDNNNYFEELWKVFFNTIAIKERKNLKRQMGFMPKKYWNCIVEMEENNEKSY